MAKQISVFEPQEINGQIVEPLCIPHLEDDTLSSTVAAATNLLWFAFHITLANKNPLEARRVLKMLRAVIEDEVEKEFWVGLDEAIGLLDRHLMENNKVDKGGEKAKTKKKPK